VEPARDSEVAAPEPPAIDAPLAHERRGAGPPLVLVHALGTDRHMWDPVLDRLAAERDVIALDLPGFGASPVLPPASPDVTPADLAVAVAAHLAALGVERPHLAGNSLGAWVALELALAGQARSVTAIAPAGLWPEPLLPRRSQARALARALRPILPLLVRSARGRRAALAGSIAHPERVPPRAALQLVRAYANAPGFDAVNAGMRAGRFTGLGRLRVPVTLAWPDRDRLVSRPRVLPPGLHEVVLRGCGHMPTWDDPEQVAAVILAGSR
jgi:pimeloyl-ACP methyl ester carboxylesterase